jgi:hypothetical protein
MKKFIESVWSFFDAMGTARAAAFLARQGRITEAKAMYGE